MEMQILKEKENRKMVSAVSVFVSVSVPVFAWLFDLQLSIYQCHNRTSEDAERA